jgi:hypothetical protein
LVLAWATAAWAQIFVGTWLRTDAGGKGITMTVERCCNGGLRLTYHIPSAGNQPAATMTVDSPMDGTEAPALIGGKPSGEMMAVKRIDDRHYTGVVKMAGQLMGTYNATISADGKMITNEGVVQMGGTSQKVTETWVRQ